MAKKPDDDRKHGGPPPKLPTREEKKDAVRPLTPKQMEEKYGPKPTKKN